MADPRLGIGLLTFFVSLGFVSYRRLRGAYGPEFDPDRVIIHCGAFAATVSTVILPTLWLAGWHSYRGGAVESNLLPGTDIGDLLLSLTIIAALTARGPVLDYLAYLKPDE